ncbi:MAG: penicillin acylase family protein [Alphaproteobacteria bacterium]|nr:penicillin acylase family protein [Alphaproteobacteria bacterium]MCB9794330.1 penicillin acylase family protein [Alphaproteobacteria bacterium]
MFVLALLLACPAKRSFPPPEQDVALDLSAPVEIRIDTRGVPHVYGDSLEDVFTAIGFLHARDRGFQLELMRAAASGRLTELFGARMLDADRRLRLLSHKIESMDAALPERERARLEAYVAGINRGREELPEPLELRLLGYEPEPWAVKDVLLIARLQALDLSHDFSHEMARDKLRALTEDPERFAFLTQPTWPLGASVTEPDPKLWPLPQGQAKPPEGLPLIAEAGLGELESIEVTGDVSPEMGLIQGAVQRWLETQDAACSNAWAVHGSRTESGRAHLAGDPHLGLSTPSVFYELHFVTPELDVYGATFPGMPMVVIGRGARSAWSPTVSYADTQDLYVITPDPEDPSRYLLDGESLPFEVRQERFRLSDDEVITEDFLSTEFGPLVNAGREGRGRPDTLYALKWVALEDAPLEITTIFERFWRAETGVEALAAGAGITFPSQNWTFATANGDIGWVLGGVLPRGEPSPLPLDGHVRRPPPAPPAERPRVLNPPQGYVVGTNQPHAQSEGNLGTLYAGPYRALRATMALDGAEGWSMADSRGLQMDLLNLEAARVVGALLEGVEGASLEPGAQSMVRALGEWDHQMRKELSAPLIYEAWRGALHRELAALNIPDPQVAQDWVRRRMSEPAMEEALFTEAGRRWWDSPLTPEIETREQAILRALQTAEAELRVNFGEDPEGWTWGAAHQLVLEHPFGAKKVLQPWFGPTITGVDGGRHVLFALGHAGVTGDFTSGHGPAMRHVVEPGGEGGFVLAGGNAGQPGHPFADNQLEDWLRNQQHRSDVQAGDVEVAAELTLRPRPR